MVTIHLTGKLTEDRQLLVDIPDNIPPGDVQLTLEVTEVSVATSSSRERVRAKLANAGALSTVWKAPTGTLPPTEDELLHLGTLPSGSPSLADLVNEDRSERLICPPELVQVE